MLFNKNQIAKVTKFILENKDKLMSERFDIDSFDTRVMKFSYFYDTNVSENFKIHHPISYQLINMQEFPEYLLWYKGKRKIESLI